MSKEITDKKITELIRWSRQIKELREITLKEIEDKDDLDPLKQDLILLQFNALSTLFGVMSIRLGLSMTLSKENVQAENAEEESTGKGI